MRPTNGPSGAMGRCCTTMGTNGVECRSHIVEFDGQFFLAAGDKGVCTLEGNVVQVIKDTFASTGVYRLDKRLGFVEPMQKKARVIISSRAARKLGQPGASDV